MNKDDGGLIWDIVPLYYPPIFPSPLAFILTSVALISGKTLLSKEGAVREVEILKKKKSAAQQQSNLQGW